MSTVRIMRPEARAGTGPRDEKTGRIAARREKIRSAMKARSKRMDDEYPEALDLAADAMATAAEELSGSTTLLCPPWQDDSHWRAIFRGEYAPLGIEDGLCRLATSTRPEARSAAAAYIAVIAGHLGKTLADLPQSAEQIHEALATATRELADVVARVTAAAVDGYDARELDAIAAEVREMVDAGTRLLGSVYRARENSKAGKCS